MEIINWITSNADNLIVAATSIVAAASAIAAVFGKSNNKYLEWARKIVNYAALNFGKAKNKEDEK